MCTVYTGQVSEAPLDGGIVDSCVLLSAVLTASSIRPGERMTISSRPVVCYSDVGGTFTDCFVVTESGEYALGKAPTTPDDIASGFIAALDMAREALGLERAEFLDSLEVVGYGATTVLNSLLTRRGGSPGLLITRGFEDLLLMERGKQSWVQLSRVDRIHPVVHRHQRPLIARQRVKGISERVNSLGQEIIPLREQDVARGGPRAR